MPADYGPSSLIVRAVLRSLGVCASLSGRPAVRYNASECDGSGDLSHSGLALVFRADSSIGRSPGSGAPHPDPVFFDDAAGPALWHRIASSTGA